MSNRGRRWIRRMLWRLLRVEFCGDCDARLTRLGCLSCGGPLCVRCAQGVRFRCHGCRRGW